MARAATIARAETLVEVYRRITDQPVVVVHSRKTAREQKAALDAVVSRQARIVICVDMLGEGYNLPALKIAALHDAHRGLGVTLQFIGRFTRTAYGIGPATTIANTADPKISAVLEELYSQDADWNVLLQDLADGAVGRHLRRVEFLDGFDDTLGVIALQNIQPRMSAAQTVTEPHRTHVTPTVHTGQTRGMTRSAKPQSRPQMILRRRDSVP
jgi:hypothetical protein